MLLTSEKLARLIDISAVQAQHGEREILELVRRAKEHRFVAVHVLPSWVGFLKAQLAGRARHPDRRAGRLPVGRRTPPRSRWPRPGCLIADGVQELDMVLNVGKLRSGEHDYVRAGHPRRRGAPPGSCR